MVVRRALRSLHQCSALPIRSLLHGPLPERWATLPDATPAQRWPLALLIVALLVFGVKPGLLINQIKPAAAKILQNATSGMPPSTDASRAVAQIP